MSHDDENERLPKRPSAPEFDRFGLGNSVGSYRYAEPARATDWTRPWTWPPQARTPTEEK
jgi:hypothetical protein